MKERFGFWFELTSATRDFPDNLALVKRTSGRLIALGVLAVAGGLLAIGNAFVATKATLVVLGVLFITGGVVNAVQAMTCRKWNHALLDVLAAAVYFVAGVFTFTRPLVAAETLTIVVSALFVVSGLVRFIGSLAMQPAHWGWLMLNGAATLLVGLLIFAGLPLSGLLGPGLLVGTDLLFSGLAAIAFGLFAKKSVNSGIGSRDEDADRETMTRPAA
jgi:uncharacterized membrane protein HdeD (DUF308 family)